MGVLAIPPQVRPLLSLRVRPRCSRAREATSSRCRHSLPHRRPRGRVRRPPRPRRRPNRGDVLAAGRRVGSKCRCPSCSPMRSGACSGIAPHINERKIRRSPIALFHRRETWPTFPENRPDAATCPTTLLEIYKGMERATSRATTTWTAPPRCRGAGGGRGTTRPAAPLHEPLAPARATARPGSAAPRRTASTRRGATTVPP